VLRLVDILCLIAFQGINMSIVSEDQPDVPPTDDSVHSDGSSSTARLIHYGSDLFSYDQRTAANQILISGETSSSKVEYDEYVVYTKPSVEHKAPTRGHRKRRHSETHVTHRFSQDDTSGAAMLDLAFRHDYTLDRNGEFRVIDEDDDTFEDMHGRVRRVCVPNQFPTYSDSLVKLTAHST
jgi:hypothetical protein